MAWGALRFCAALWLVFYIAYTPIHLYLEPHCEHSHARAGDASAHSGDCVAWDTHEGDDQHERHPAAQHEFEVTQPTRPHMAPMLPVQALDLMNLHEHCPQPQVSGYSGLSPPEFSCPWQFIFRAALPVRAPSLLS